jgi:hypothetical protein
MDGPQRQQRYGKYRADLIASPTLISASPEMKGSAIGSVRRTESTSNASPARPADKPSDSVMKLPTENSRATISTPTEHSNAVIQPNARCNASRRTPIPRPIRAACISKTMLGRHPEIAKSELNIAG